MSIDRLISYANRIEILIEFLEGYDDARAEELAATYQTVVNFIHFSRESAIREREFREREFEELLIEDDLSQCSTVPSPRRPPSPEDIFPMDF